MLLDYHEHFQRLGKTSHTLSSQLERRKRRTIKIINLRCVNTGKHALELLNIKKLATTRSCIPWNSCGSPHHNHRHIPRSSPPQELCPPPSPKVSAPHEQLRWQPVVSCPCYCPSPLWPSDPCLQKPSDHVFLSNSVNIDVWVLLILCHCSTLKQLSPWARSYVEPAPPLTGPHQPLCWTPISFLKKLPVWTVTEPDWGQWAVSPLWGVIRTPTETIVYFSFHQDRSCPSQPPAISHMKRFSDKH